ncbi:MAG TPA: hypothetical protein PKA53_03900 [Sphingobacterium sp.]|nr:hypothetical protein [Sphingobacterium sp.]
MKSLTLTIFALALLTAACTPENEGPDPKGKVASLSVVNVSGKASIPNQIQIDGLYSSKTSLGIGNGSQATKYEEIEAGVRNVTLGSYKDTVHLAENNYYTLMVYDNDSLMLSWDASYTSDNKFVIMPQVRWNMAGDNPQNYRVDIYADSLLGNIIPNQFTSVSGDNKTVKLSLYRKSNTSNLLGEKEVQVEANKKVTVNIKYNESTQKYDFTPIMQSVQ